MSDTKQPAGPRRPMSEAGKDMYDRLVENRKAVEDRDRLIWEARHLVEPPLTWDKIREATGLASHASIALAMTNYESRKKSADGA